MTYEEAKKAADMYNSILSEQDKKYKKWIVTTEDNENYSVVLQYKIGGRVSAISRQKRMEKGIFLTLIIYLIWKNL